ncbi:MAG: GAF domain-containing protein [Bryobacterales bacterium]|nr:GAF domain-containing protein [Bryobacterales bacterium]
MAIGKLGRGIRVGAWLLAMAAWGQAPLGLEQVGARKSPDMTPALEGKQVRVQATVASKPILFGEYAHLPLRDGTAHGLVLEAPDFMFEQVTPGDVLEVRGVIAQRGGMPVLRPFELSTASQSAPPQPLSRRIQQLQHVEAVGLTALIQGRVVALGEDAGGEYVLLSDDQPVPYPVYLPRTANQIGSGLNRYRVGDRVRVTGMAAQAASEAPFNNKFRMVVADASAVSLVERNWLVSPQVLLAAMAVLFGVGGLVLLWHQKKARVRRSIRRIHGFCEELLTAATLEDVYRKLRTLAPRTMEISSVEVFRYDRTGQVLRRTVAPGPETLPARADRNDQRTDHAVSLCFRNRTPLHIPDTRRSSLYWGANRESIPRGVVLLPMFAREELIGVLEVAQYERPRRFHLEELTALQHMANQVAMVLKLIEQLQKKEQLMRSERLAATGQIISGVAGELRGPLESILSLAHKLLEHGDPEAKAILNESLRATAILSRYSQVAAKDEEVSNVEMNALVQSAVAGCRKEMQAGDLQVQMALSGEALWVAGASKQLEMVIKNLILLAARSARASLDRTVKVESALSMRRVVVAVQYGVLYFDETLGAERGAGRESEGLGFSVCKGILHGQGGDIRVVRAGENSCRLEVDLPAAFPEEAAPAAGQNGHKRGSRALTALILEPDVLHQRRLISYWAGRKHRAVPVVNETEALELLRRVRIDVVFCAVRIGAGNWVEFFDQVRNQVAVFVLLADGMESDASTLFPDGEGLLLRKPMEAGEMDRLLGRIEQRVESVAQPSAS